MQNLNKKRKKEMKKIARNIDIKKKKKMQKCRKTKSDI